LSLGTCELILEQVWVYYSSPTIFAHNGHYSISELSLALTQLAEHLIALGAGPEARAAILIEKLVLHPLPLLAGLESVATFVFLNPSYQPRSLKELAEELNLFIVLSTLSSVNIEP